MKQRFKIRPSIKSDHSLLENIRLKAFAPIFDSFRSILGDQIYTLAQEPEDSVQSQILRDMFLPETEWQLYVVELSGEVIGFVSIRIDSESKVGEIGLNAVDPDYSGQGTGTELYRFASNKLKLAGMRVATVATGGDRSHEPARRAYEKAGFNVQFPSVWMCKIL